jgi:hypothetical protein
LKAIICAFVALCIAAGVASWARGNTEFVMYLVVMIVLGVMVGLVHRKLGFSAGLLWALWAWAALHMAGGLVPVPESWPINGDIRVLYSWWLVPDYLKYDQVVHAYGFATATTATWQGLSRVWPGLLRPTAGMLAIVAVCGMGFGALNEVVEFIATRLTDTNVGGYVNTGWDLVSNLVGCGAACVLIRIRTPAESLSSASSCSSGSTTS